jgi:6-phosphogluconolactonase
MLINAEIIVPGDLNETQHYAAQHFITLCRDAISDHGSFAVALSGGSTPKAIYEILTQPPYSEEIEWEKVHLFWSDERSVAPSNPESNHHMAMKAGFAKVPLPPAHIHRMVAEHEIEKHALAYEEKILSVLEDRSFDLVMLGMGEDGHTASLFPGTKGLEDTGRLVVANFVPQKNTWRMTLTFEAINAAHFQVFYVTGKAKAAMVATVMQPPPTLPCQLVGTDDHPALWILDKEAASDLLHNSG